jgi:ubiquinone/menaquinone biosynthesis C-methylase UbiE
MNQTETARSGYFQGERLELGLRYAYRPEFIPLLLDYLGARSHTRILQVGCGSGFLARLLTRTLTEVQVVGLDTDPDLLDMADQLLDRERLTENVTLAQGDAYQLPFPDATFDLVTSHRML